MRLETHAHNKPHYRQPNARLRRTLHFREILPFFDTDMNRVQNVAITAAL